MYNVQPPTITFSSPPRFSALVGKDSEHRRHNDSLQTNSASPRLFQLNALGNSLANRRPSKPPSSPIISIPGSVPRHNSAISHLHHPHPKHPIAITANLSSSSPASPSFSPLPSPRLPAAPSPKFPLSPVISARPSLRPSSPVPLPHPSSVHPWKSESPSELDKPRRRSSNGSSLVEDVLSQGDIVGEGLPLQDEPLRLVSLHESAVRTRTTDDLDAEDPEPAKEFEVVRRLGAGSYAVVYLVREILSREVPSEDGHVGAMDLEDRVASTPVRYGRNYAIKCLSKANLNEEDLAAQMSEVTIHQSLQPHPNIVTLHRTFETSSFLLLLLEFVPGEDLFYFLEQARDHYDSELSGSPSLSSSGSSTPLRTPPTPSLLSSLNPEQLLSPTRLRLVTSMFAQMCEAVAACHDQRVFHRDIKPENFIVTDGWASASGPDGGEKRERKVVVKLTDFGLSTTDEESSDMDCGSAPYMSYECRNNVAPIYKPRAADVWSLGIVLINMLYHYNPWMDTAQGACSSFDLYCQQPVNFFLQRFTGMTRPVAEFLANNVFCILDGSDPRDDSRRISAHEFGRWVRDNLTALLAEPLAIADGTRPSHKRVISTSSIQGHPISSCAPSRRPSSRQASISGSVLRTPVIHSRVLSRAPSLGPAFEVEVLSSELSTVIDQEGDEQEQEDAEHEENEDAEADTVDASRSTSTTKRRKRGARKGKSAGVPTDTLETLAVASQSLAREISMASRSSSHARVVRSTTTIGSHIEDSFVGSNGVLSSAPVVAAPVELVIPSQNQPAVVKKPSKWKLSLRKNSTSAGRVSPVDEIFASDGTAGKDAGSKAALGVAPPAAGPGASAGMASGTVSNVSSLIMSLNSTAAPHANPAVPSVPAPSPADEALTWTRGRRLEGPGSISSSASFAPGMSRRSPPSSLERWGQDGPAKQRGTSPTSSRSGRPVASSGSSTHSSNWRSSMSTTSSASTSTSAFTRYSNSSMRSVSTAATSISSSSSWRAQHKTPGPGQHPPLNLRPGVDARTIPKNVKLMSGVPWELDELPRQMHPNPVGDIFGAPPVRKQRTRKPKDSQLDTINERFNERLNDRPVASRDTPVHGLCDAATSTTDLDGVARENGSDGTPKKVQKGQINALAKMLSALRR